MVKERKIGPKKNKYLRDAGVKTRNIHDTEILDIPKPQKFRAKFIMESGR